MLQKARNLLSSVCPVVPYWGVIVLLAYMPFHIFLSQSVSLATGELAVWKVAKDVIIFVLFLFTLYAVRKWGNVPRWFWWLAGGTTVYALLHILLWMTHPHIYAQSAILGITYNVRIPCLLIIGAGATLLQPAMFSFRSLFRIILIVSTITATLGVLQYFLPKDTLTHVGYSLPRGVRPNFFIDDNPVFPRVMSTLRDPNSFGAYLLLPIAALTSLLARRRPWRSWHTAALVGTLALHLLALYFTFSRSAWLGAVVAMALVVWLQFSSQLVRFLRKGWPVVAIVVVLLVGVTFWQRHNAAVDGVLTHSTATQVGQYDSNELHWMYAKQGALGIWHQPLGHGPGTAGLASIQDPAGGRLTENYYVQVGYEVGVLGLALFIAGNVWVYYRLWRRHDSWSIVLLSSFWAYVVMNMLLHTWSNEAVATQWWLTAGVGLAVTVHSQRQNPRKTQLTPCPGVATTPGADVAACKRSAVGHA